MPLSRSSLAILSEIDVEVAFKNDLDFFNHQLTVSNTHGIDCHQHLPQPMPRYSITPVVF